MKTGWLTHAGPYKVEHVPVRRVGAFLVAAAFRRRKGVMHTTEGHALEGALARFRVETVGSTFIVGRDLKGRPRILQCLPLGEKAAALKHTGKTETNGLAIAQVELVGVSPIGKTWLPDPQVFDRLAALVWQLHKDCGIPLEHVANPSRSNARWMATVGWVGHVDVPQNDHVDPRKLNYKALFARARLFSIKPGLAHLAPAPKGKIKPKPRKVSPLSRTAALKRRAKRTPPAPICGIPA